MNIKKIIQEIAINNNSAEEEVYREMQLAIDLAFSSQKQTEYSFSSAASGSAAPSAEEFLTVFAAVLKESLSTQS